MIVEEKALRTRMGAQGTDKSLDNLVGPADIASRAGVTRPTVSNWKKRGFLPEPATYVGGTPAWWWDDILPLIQEKVEERVSKLEKQLATLKQFQ